MTADKDRPNMRETLDRIKGMAGNPDFISGIYNYCDRWCERCNMTSRCSVFAMSGPDSENGNPQTAEDIDKLLTETFESTSALLQELAEEAGIDVEAVVEPTGEAFDQEAGDCHVLVRDAENYATAVHDWFVSWEPDLLDASHGAPHAQPHLVMVGDTSKASQIEDLVDTILWYHTLINAKLLRAVQNDVLAPSAPLQVAKRDADGSAKVALMAVDRSAAAWTRLLEFFPEAELEILAFRHRLERLRRATEWAFPNARDFVRPGFDDTRTAAVPVSPDSHDAF